MNTKKRSAVISLIPIRYIKVECADGGSAILCYIKIRNNFRFSKSAQFHRCFLGQNQPCNYIVLRVLQENVVVGHPGRKHRRITMAIPFALMPPHSSHAQMTARFFGCALIIVPLARGGDVFSPTNGLWRTKSCRATVTAEPSVWLAHEIGCVLTLRYCHMKCHHVFDWSCLLPQPGITLSRSAGAHSSKPLIAAKERPSVKFKTQKVYKSSENSKKNSRLNYYNSFHFT